MTRFLPFVLLAACNGLSALNAESELLLSATMGEEEGVLGADAKSELLSSTDPDRPQLFRDCATEDDYSHIWGQYDTDGDGALSETERDAVAEAREGRSREEDHRMAQRWEMITLIYDVDADGALSESERGELESDFSARCEALHARLVAEFDTDGDGELSAEEQATAEEAMAARFEEMRSEEGERPDGPPEGEEGGPPQGQGGPGGSEDCEGGPPAGAQGEGMDSGALPPPVAEFDTDGDGVLSDSELTALREDLRARIRSGEPLGPQGRPE